MRHLMQHMLPGVGFGASAYLFILCFSANGVTVSREKILSILVMSALIGLWSSIFDFDWLPFLPLLFLHFVGTAIIVGVTGWLTNCFGSKISDPSMWIIFITIYLVVWCVLQLYQEQEVRKINRVLARKRSEED
ncbi:DUF3021 domain-containing protein [Leuconostocaceae bacterium ESL0958]|nr:DUF3021 domain-containing protein [Leuconostocaceae bacterium ESL0958]